MVDDDPLAVQLVQNCILNTPFLTLVGSCENAIQASDFLHDNPVDLLLLDIQMPLMSGLELLRTLPVAARPLVILITTNPHYAVEAFEEDVVDYLVKPISYGRFMKAVQKARDEWEMVQSMELHGAASAGLPAPGADFTFLKIDSRLVKIPFAEVSYVEALGDYVHLVTDQKKHIVYATMKAVSTRFPESRFMRVHRSFIVNVSRITAIEDNAIHIGGRLIPIGQTYLRDVLKRINQY